MPNLFDYLTWRGDLSLERVPFCAVDGLILSTLSYIHFEELVPQGLDGPVTIAQAAERYFALPPARRGRCRCEDDLRLLRALADAPRFSGLRLACRAERFVPQEEMQFGALAVLLGDGSAFLAFRGTDSTLVGWKEDFNMSFLDAVPAQLAAAEYVQDFAARFSGALRLGGHSKGGNLAVFAAALCPAAQRDRITAVYSFDGPGFTSYLLGQSGYQELLTRIRRFVPQSSVVGMLLEHEEPYTVMKSCQVGLLQHDPYSWQVLGGDFVRLEQVTAGSRVADRTLKGWLSGLTPQQRETVVDTVYELLSSGDAQQLGQALQPQNLPAAFQALKDIPQENLRVLAACLGSLARATAQAVREER